MGCAIFGAGERGLRTFSLFHDQYDIVCFCDNNLAKQGQQFESLQVIAPELLVKNGLEVIVATVAHFEIAQQLFAMGIKSFYIVRDNYTIDFIDLSVYDDISVVPGRVCILEDVGTGVNARALLKYNSYSDIELLVCDRRGVDAASYYTMMTSELVITQMAEKLIGKKTIELWHGFPVKALYGASADTKAHANTMRVSERFNARSAVCSYSKLYNLLMDYCIGIRHDLFYETGMPRNDLLLLSDGKANLNKLLGRASCSKTVMYAPTFREHQVYGYSSKDMPEGLLFFWQGFLFSDLDEFLKEHDIMMLIRIHPYELTKISPFSSDNILFITDEMLEKAELSFYELLNASDMLITDYSSISIDYLLLDKPIIFTVRDIEEYSRSHGLMLNPFEAWAPGEVVYEYKCLKEAVHTALYNEDRFKSKRELVRNITHTYNDANSSKRVLDLARSIMIK